MEISDQDHLLLLKDGNESAFDQIFRKYYQGLCLFAKKYVKDLEIAEEVVQDLFYKLWEKRNDLELKTSVKSYLFTSVRNSCIDFIRHEEVKNKYAKEYIKESKENDLSENDNYVDREMIDKVYLVIQAMPEQRQKIFRMNRFDGLKYREIADQLGLSIKTVEAHMGSALKQLRETLKNYINQVVIFLIINLLG